MLSIPGSPKTELPDGYAGGSVRGEKRHLARALPAGMTVEAAVVLPVFLFAVANLLSLFLVFWTYSSKEAQLHQTARQLALYA